MNKLYEKQLKTLLNKKHSKEFTLTDGLGLGARVSVNGKIRWQYRYKIDGKNKRLDLGYYPEISLKNARELLQQCRDWLAQGLDPKLQSKIKRTETLKPVSVKDALEYWLVEYASRNRANVDKHRMQFARHVYPYIGDYPLASTETRHWIECFDRIKNGIAGKRRAAPKAAGYVFLNAKQALRYCRVRRYADSRALDDLTISDVGSKQRKRDRVLSDKELRDVLVATDNKTFNAYVSNLLKLLIYFGARTQEVRLSTWKEWDFDANTWTVPKAHSKTEAVIARPIPSAVRDWLLALKGSAPKESYILGELKKSPAVSVAGGNIWKKLEHEEKWTLHDLRRSFATKMNDLGVMPHVVEHLLGHSLGGVMSIYNHSQYIPEKQKALDMWLERLSILSNPADNILILKA